MILVSLVLAVAQQGQPQPPAHQPALVRPRDPFVFRCVLDKRARMLVAALDDDMWAAWDTASGAFVKAWKGGVNFDGAVYTTVHGPQPTSKGQDYITCPDESPWIAYVDGKPVETKTHYVGYVLREKGVTLEWKVTFGAAREVLVSEWPDFWRVADDWPLRNETREIFKQMRPALRRHFTAVGLRDGEQINLVFRQDGSASIWAMKTERDRKEDVVTGADENGHPVRAEHFVSELPLNTIHSQNVLMLGFKPITLPPTTEEKK